MLAPKPTNIPRVIASNDTQNYLVQCHLATQIDFPELERSFTAQELIWSSVTFQLIEDADGSLEAERVKERKNTFGNNTTLTPTSLRHDMNAQCTLILSGWNETTLSLKDIINQPDLSIIMQWGKIVATLNQVLQNK